MRTIFYFLFGVTVVGTIVFLTGCNNKKGGDGDPTPAVAGIAAVPAPFFGTCGGLVNGANGGTVGFGAYSRSQQNYAFPNANGGVMRVEGAFAAIMREAMNICDRGGIDGGTASCGGLMAVSVNSISLLFNQQTPNQPRMIISSQRVQTNQPNQFNYSYSLPTFRNFITGIMLGNPTVGMNQLPVLPQIDLQNSTVWPYGGEKGFQVTAQGPQYSKSGLKKFELRVPVGKCEDGSFAFQLFYDGQIAATGNMVRVVQ